MNENHPLTLRHVLTEVAIRTNFAGLHHWPEAPKEVEFLRNLHRHLFGVRVNVSVAHSDRDVEFFLLQRDVEKYGIHTLVRHLEQNPRMSCEQMAQWIAEKVHERGYRVIQVEVNEDGENGAILYYDYEPIVESAAEEPEEVATPPEPDEFPGRLLKAAAGEVVGDLTKA